MSEYSFASQFSGNLVILRFEGYFNEQAGRTIRQSLCEGQAHDVRNLVLNLEKTSVINSPGITQILELVEDFICERKGQVALVGVSQLYQEVFQVVGLTGMATMCADEKSALENIAASDR
ncbi:MAG: STAS domain-containing protein [Candidatus Riflebacteria bacterium]|nr:STAS domain-containing protein [Candidatus Riflebacteria bacterium]